MNAVDLKCLVLYIQFDSLFFILFLFELIETILIMRTSHQWTTNIITNTIIVSDRLKKERFLHRLGYRVYRIR